MSDGTNGNGATGDASKPPPHCPVCGTEMTLTIEHRDDDAKVWVRPRLAEHPPPPAGRWWTEPPFAAP